MLADDNIKLPISVAERITHDTLLYYLELVEFDVERFAKKKKLKPSAKCRNRGDVCVPAERAKDHKDHFEINTIGQARNALARVHQYSSLPSEYVAFPST